MTKSAINKGTKTSDVRGKDIYNPQILSGIYIRTPTNHKKNQKLPDRNMGKGNEPTTYIRRNPNGQ